MIRWSFVVARTCRRTGLIGYFKLIGEEAVAKGVRRITAITGQPLDRLESTLVVVDELTAKLNCRADELPVRVEALQEELKKLQKQMEKSTAASLAAAIDKLIDEAPTIGATKLIINQLPTGSVELMRTQIDRIHKKSAQRWSCLAGAKKRGKSG